MKRVNGRIMRYILNILKRLKIDGVAWYIYVFYWQRLFPDKEMKKENEYYSKNVEEIERILVNLGDEKSRETYTTMIDFRTKRRKSVKRIVDKGDQYFPHDILRLKDESFVDCGAYTGDTIESFINNSLGKCYRSIYAFEPVHLNYIKLKEYVNSNNIERCELYEMGTSDREDVQFFSGEGNDVKLTEKGVNKIAVNSLDNVLANNRISFIKMDIEGAETDTLIGAKNIIVMQRPILAVCIYHKKEDMINIPLMLMDWLKDYGFYVRHYTLDWCDTVFYAIPNERRVIRKV